MQKLMDDLLLFVWLWQFQQNITFTKCLLPLDMNDAGMRLVCEAFEPSCGDVIVHSVLTLKCRLAFLLIDPLMPLDTFRPFITMTDQNQDHIDFGWELSARN